MKPLWIWLLVTLGVFAGGSAAYHSYLEHSPRRVAVVIDTSYDMRASLTAAANTASAVAANTRYAEIAYFSDKAQLSDFQRHARVPPLSAYGPRQFDRLSDGALADQLADAERVIFISNAPVSERARLPGSWEHIIL